MHTIGQTEQPNSYMNNLFARARLLPVAIRVLILIGALILQAAIVSVLLPRIGLAGGTVSIITIVVGGLLFGIRGGVGTVAVAILLNALLGTLIIGESFFAVFRSGIVIGLFALLLVGILVGYFSTLQLALHSAHFQLEEKVLQRTAELDQRNRELRDEVVERKATEEQLQRAKTTLEGATKARDQFLASISHELRTPLTMIVGHTDALDEGLFGELNQEQSEAVSQILQSSTHLVKLIDSILDYNRFSTQNVSINRETVTIEPICVVAMQMVEPLAHQRNILLTLDNNIDGLVAAVDEVQITQILVNLLDNAIKFTPVDGQVGLDVTSNSQPLNAQLNSQPSSGEQTTFSLSVWDTGIGLKQNDLEAIFEPFIQIPTDTNTQQKGAGLGLSLVQQMVSLHDGTIAVESKIDGGSRFTVTLPVYES